MVDKVLENLLEWGKPRGLNLHANVARTDVGGYYGMLATSAIKKGEKIVSLPLAATIQIDGALKYPKTMPADLRYIHAVACEYAKGEASDYWPIFAAFESLEDFAGCSTYFIDEAEAKLIQGVSSSLLSKINELNNATSYRINKILEFDGQLNSEHILFVALNHFSRAWGELGFLPVVDLFNHSDSLGVKVETVDGNATMVAERDYAQGEEIYLNYGRKDMFLHAIGFNYFDPSSEHFINFGSRFIQSAQSPKEIAALNALRTQFPILIDQSSSLVRYRLDDADAVFMEHKPSDRVISYVRSQCVSEASVGLSPAGGDKLVYARLIALMELILADNKVEQASEQDFSARIQRFYHLLKKEKQMIRTNLQWLKSQR